MRGVSLSNAGVAFHHAMVTGSVPAAITRRPKLAHCTSAAASSTSHSVATKPTDRPARLVSVSASACSLDQRTPKQPRRMRPAPCPDQPIAPVGGAAEHAMLAAADAEGRHDVRRLDAGDVRADDQHGTRRGAIEDALHAMAEVAPPLRRSRRVRMANAGSSGSCPR
jgi:hypothetical protein